MGHARLHPLPALEVLQHAAVAVCTRILCTALQTLRLASRNCHTHAEPVLLAEAGEVRPWRRVRERTKQAPQGQGLHSQEKVIPLAEGAVHREAST